MKTFVAYRRNISERDTHTHYQKNPDDMPQYEGVIFADGKCVLHWLTASASVSVFDCFQDMINVHGHPEYGTELVFDDNELPVEWMEALVAYANKLQVDHDNMGIVVVRDDRGQLLKVALENPDDINDEIVVYPVAEAA